MNGRLDPSAFYRVISRDGAFIRLLDATGQAVGGGGGGTGLTPERLKLLTVIKNAYRYTKSDTSQPGYPFPSPVYLVKDAFTLLENNYLLQPPLWSAGAAITPNNRTFRTSSGQIYSVGNLNGTVQGFAGGTAVFGSAEPNHTSSDWVVDSAGNYIVAHSGSVQYPGAASDPDKPNYFVAGITAASITNNYNKSQILANVNFESANQNPTDFGGSFQIFYKSIGVMRFTTGSRYVRIYGANGSLGGVMVMVNGKLVYPGPVYADTYSGAPLVNGIPLNAVELDMGTQGTRNFEFYFMNVNPPRIYSMQIDAGQTLAPYTGGSAKYNTAWLKSVVFGSSFEGGANGSLYGITWADTAAMSIGCRVFDKFALGGCGFISNNLGGAKNVPAQIRDNAANLYAQGYDVAFLAGLINDANGFTPAQIKAAILDAYAAARAQPSLASAVLVFVGGLYPGNDLNGDTRFRNVIAAELAMQDAVAQMDSNCVFVPVVTDEQPWITGGGYTSKKTGDGTSDFVIGGWPNESTHPSAFGQQYISKRVLSRLAKVL